MIHSLKYSWDLSVRPFVQRYRKKCIETKLFEGKKRWKHSSYLSDWTAEAARMASLTKLFLQETLTMESYVIQSNVSEKISKVLREITIMKSYLQYEKKTATQLCSYEFVKFSLKLFKKHLWTDVCVSNTRLCQMIWFTVSIVQLLICFQCTLSLPTFSLQHFQGIEKRCIGNKWFNTRAKWRISLLLQ